MEKKVVQDVRPPENNPTPQPKPVRKAPVRKRAPAIESQLSVPEKTHTENSSLLTKKRQPNEAYREFINAIDNSTAPLPPKPRRLRGKKWWVGLPVLFVALFFVVSFMFESAEVAITPKTERVNLNLSFNAVKGTSENDNDIPFELITLSKETTMKVNTAGEEKVEKKASGKIVVFNKHSQATQRLVANTRFETSTGLIYRIPAAVTVPGFTKKASGEIVPGSIVVSVTADQSGDKYNIGKTDFTVPGFDGDPRFDNIYARSETDMTGGFSGVMKKVDAATLESAEKEMQTVLKDALLSTAALQIPKDYLVYPGTVVYSFEDMPQTDQTNSTVTLHLKGTMSGVMLSENSLNKRLSKETITTASPEEIEVNNLHDLNVSLASSTVSISSEMNQIPLTLSGDTEFTWKIDVPRIKASLAGKAKSDLGSILSIFPAVEKAQVILRPFWKHNFPKNTSKIEVLTEQSPS
jgi:hypothetical protein